MNIAIYFRCDDGGHGWGETGQICKIVDKDLKSIVPHIPGGWEVTNIVATREPEGLDPNYKGIIP